MVHATASADALPRAVLDVPFRGIWTPQVPTVKSVAGIGGFRPTLTPAVPGGLEKLTDLHSRLLLATVDRLAGPKFTADDLAMLRQLRDAPLCLDLVRLEDEVKVTKISPMNLLVSAAHLEHLHPDTVMLGEGALVVG